MKTCFDFYTDPGHGWLKVPRKLLTELGIQFAVTHYSYQRGEYVFLEEDTDMGHLYEALRKLGKEPKRRIHYSDKRSKIRGYEPYFADGLFIRDERPKP